MQIWDVFPFPRIGCFKSEKKARKFVRKMTDGKADYSSSGFAGQCDLYEESVTGEYFVVIRVDGKGKNTTERVALLAHECSHLVDFFEHHIGEEKLGTETRAYAIQCAMTACLNQLGEEWLTPRA